MIMDNLGTILMTVGFLLVVTAVIVALIKTEPAKGDGSEFSDWV